MELPRSHVQDLRFRISQLRSANIDHPGNIELLRVFQVIFLPIGQFRHADPTRLEVAHPAPPPKVVVRPTLVFSQVFRFSDPSIHISTHILESDSLLYFRKHIRLMNP